jgi:hypothetical protein
VAHIFLQLGYVRSLPLFDPRPPRNPRLLLDFSVSSVFSVVNPLFPISGITLYFFSDFS